MEPFPILNLLVTAASVHDVDQLRPTADGLDASQMRSGTADLHQSQLRERVALRSGRSDALCFAGRFAGLT
jgi:hypothetical protein